MVEAQMVWLLAHYLPSLSKLMALFFITKYIQLLQQVPILLQLLLKRELTLPQLSPMPGLLSPSQDLPLLINISSPTSKPSSTPMLMTPPLAAAQPNAQPKLVSMSKSTPQYVSTATLLKTWSTTPTTEPAHADLDSTLIPPRPSSASPAQLFTVQSVTQPTLQFALLVLLELSLMPPPILALAELDTLSTEPLALNALTNVKTAVLLLEPVPHVLTVPTEI